MSERGRRAVRRGVVVSDKMDKTVVVEVRRRTFHPLFKKIITRSAKVHAHDPENRCGVGDKVSIRETRPLSRHKRWMVVEIIEKAK